MTREEKQGSHYGRNFKKESEMIKGSGDTSYDVDKGKETFEQQKQGMGSLLKDLDSLKPPMFFETEYGNYIHVNNIEAFDQDLYSNGCVGLPVIHTKNGSYNLTKNDVVRFKEFAKLHGVFGKEEK